MQLCGRPGCSAPASATLRFDAAGSTAWLDPLDDDPGATRLCHQHAEGLTAPRGWELHDRRFLSAPSAPAWSPRFDLGDDLDGLLDAKTPLLSRAFRSARAS